MDISKIISKIGKAVEKAKDIKIESAKFRASDAKKAEHKYEEPKQEIQKQEQTQATEPIVTVEPKTTEHYEISINTDKLSNELAKVQKIASGSFEKITNISDNLGGMKNRVDEIHSTTNSIDKLYDSVFELKQANVNFKNEIEYLKKNTKVLTIALCIICGLTLGVAIAGLIIGIILL